MACFLFFLVFSVFFRISLVRAEEFTGHASAAIGTADVNAMQRVRVSAKRMKRALYHRNLFSLLADICLSVMNVTLWS